MLLKILLEKSRLGQISRKCRQCWEQNQDQSESKQQFLRFCFSCIFASKTRRKTSSWIGCDCWNLQNSSACLGQETPSCTSLTKTLSIHRIIHHLFSSCWISSSCQSTSSSSLSPFCIALHFDCFCTHSLQKPIIQFLLLIE